MLQPPCTPKQNVLLKDLLDKGKPRSTVIITHHSLILLTAHVPNTSPGS